MLRLWESMLYYDVFDRDISMYIPIIGEDDVDEWIEFFADMCGLEKYRYYVVPLSDKYTYMSAIKRLIAGGIASKIDMEGMIVTLRKDLDMTTFFGEPVYPKAVRVLRVIPLA